MSICLQNERECLDKQNAIRIGELLYYQRYDPKDELITTLKRRITKNFT
jgi:hypothetical protein